MLLGRCGFLAQDVTQSIKSGFPASTPVGDPLLSGGHRCWFDAADASPPDLLGSHDSARLEHLNVLDHGRQGHGQRTRQLAHRSGSKGEPFNHGPPAAISQRLEGPIEVDRLVKHVLEYIRHRLDSQGNA